MDIPSQEPCTELYDAISLYIIVLLEFASHLVKSFAVVEDENNITHKHCHGFILLILQFSFHSVQPHGLGDYTAVSLHLHKGTV